MRTEPRRRAQLATLSCIAARRKQPLRPLQPIQIRTSEHKVDYQTVQGGELPPPRPDVERSRRAGIFPRLARAKLGHFRPGPLQRDGPRIRWARRTNGNSNELGSYPGTCTRSTIGPARAAASGECLRAAPRQPFSMQYFAIMSRPC